MCIKETAISFQVLAMILSPTALIIIISFTLANSQAYLENCLCEDYSKDTKLDCTCPFKSPDNVRIRFTTDNQVFLKYTNCEACKNGENLIPNTNLPKFADKISIKNACYQDYQVDRILKKFSMTNLTSLVLTYGENLNFSCNLIGYRVELISFTIESIQGINIEKDVLRNMPNLIELNLKWIGDEVITINFSHVLLLEYLSLAYNGIKEIPIKLFASSKNLKELDLLRNGLEEVHRDYFYGLEKLEVLELSQNRIKVLKEDIFTSMPNLKKVYLEQNKITSIEDNLFKNNHLLEVVSLNKNIYLEEINQSTFAGASNIKTLQLSSLLNLKKVAENAFNNLTKLENLDLSYTALSYLPNKLFLNQETLVSLNISDNEFKTLSNETFKNLENLEVLSLKKTPNLSILDENIFLPLKKLKHLDLSWNNFSKWDMDWFCNEECQSLKRTKFNLETLDLRGNKIKELPEGSLHIESLNLDSNLLEEIKLEDLLLFNPSKVILTRNNLRVINLDINKQTLDLLANSSTKIQININNNTLECGCDNYLLHKYNHKSLEDIRAIFNITQDNVLCANTGENIKNIKPCDVRCPIRNISHPCTWIRECNGLSVNCSGKNFTELTETMLGSYAVDGKLIKFNVDDITKLDFSRNMLDNVRWLPGNVQVVNLSHNQFKSISNTTLTLLNTTKSLQKIHLDGNPWECDCGFVESKDLFLNYFKMINVSHIPCITDQYICLRTYLINSILVTFLLIFLLFSIILIFYYRYRTDLRICFLTNKMFQCLHPADQRVYDYDVFIMFPEQAIPVAEEIVKKLLKMKFSVVHQYHWPLGQHKKEMIIESIERSRKTLILFSMNCLNDGDVRFAFEKAHSACLKENRPGLILIFNGDIDQDRVSKEYPELGRYINVWTGIKWDSDYFWYNLKNSLVRRVI